MRESPYSSDRSLSQLFRLRDRLRFITYSGIFTALVIGFGFALSTVPNVEAVTMMIFLAGTCLGVTGGLTVGFLGEFIFSAINPMGSGFSAPFLLVAQVITMMIVGLTGGLVGRNLLQKKGKIRIILLALTGLVLTLFYNIITGLSFPVVMGFTLHESMAYILSGIIFSVVHLISNTLMFMLILPSTYDAVIRFIPYFRREDE